MASTLQKRANLSVGPAIARPQDSPVSELA